MDKRFFFLFLVFFLTDRLLAQTINRRALVQRHNVEVTKADPLSSLTVGNGRFAFTVDVTGLQSFPEDYQKGVSLGTQSEWGWHSFVDTAGFQREEALKTYRLNGRDISYTVQSNAPERAKGATNWFRQNPHRLQLGNVGFLLLKKDGTAATLRDIQNIRQTLRLWTGEILSSFSVEGVPVTVSTLCHATKDAIGVAVQSPLVQQGRLKIQVRYPYPTGAWTDEGTNYTSTGQHESRILTSNPRSAVLEHRLDTTVYNTDVWSGVDMQVTSGSPHNFLVSPSASSDRFSCSITFRTRKQPASLLSFTAIKTSSESGWRQYWTTGGVIDFSGSTDIRAFELERRVILSQYLLKAQEAGNYPPQETGLTYNSWFGKPHLEMTWWHAAHYGYWRQPIYLQNLLAWYASVAPKARAIARCQGFEGVRWQKMTDNNGDEAPSSIGAFLIWQQPHVIYFAEQLYRQAADKKQVAKYRDLVFATADFMASFPYFDSSKGRYILGKGVIPAQERFKAEQTFNPTYELVYWHWAMETAQQWRQRAGLPRHPGWDAVVRKLSPLPVQEGKYLFTESATDSYTNPEFRTDHPSVLAAYGILPPTGQVDTSVMRRTFDWIWNNWTWKDTWGWDFPMTAMAAIRLGLPEKAVEALLMPIQTNTYLPNGHNYQDERLRIYLPGNGGLLTAIAMMVAGYDGAKMPLPGIPKDGRWKVRWEGLKKVM